MFYLIYLLIVGTSFAPFLFPKIDIWHAQGIWVQAFTLLIFCYSFFERPGYRAPKNTGLFLLNLWLGGYTAFICFMVQHKGKYDVQHFFPWFNFLCLMFLYKVIVEYLNESQVKKILAAMRYVIIATIIMAGLQYMGLSQFFEMIRRPDWYHDNPVVGFIGNGTHLSGFLAMTIPLFLTKSRENILAIIAMFLVLIVSGTSKGDPAISGFVVAAAVIFFFLFRNKKQVLLALIGGALAVSLWILVTPEQIVKAFLSPNGRFEVWAFYWGLLKQMALTGFGPGAVNIIYQDTPFANVRHLHLELFQFTFEFGLIGFFLILNVINEFFRRKANPTTKLIVFGFLVSSCFNYPAHLWLPATWALFCYAATFAERNK